MKMGLLLLITFTKNFSMILMGNSLRNLTLTGLLKHFTLQSKNCVPKMFHSVVGFHLYIWASKMEVVTTLDLFIVQTLFLFNTVYIACVFPPSFFFIIAHCTFYISLLVTHFIYADTCIILLTSH